MKTNYSIYRKSHLAKLMITDQFSTFGHTYDRIFWCVPFRENELSKKDLEFFKNIRETVPNFHLLHCLISKEHLFRLWRQINERVLIIIDGSLFADEICFPPTKKNLVLDFEETAMNDPFVKDLFLKISAHHDLSCLLLVQSGNK